MDPVMNAHPGGKGGWRRVEERYPPVELVELHDRVVPDNSFDEAYADLLHALVRTAPRVARAL